jgi:hypothetical protein
LDPPVPQILGIRSLTTPTPWESGFVLAYCKVLPHAFLLLASFRQISTYAKGFSWKKMTRIHQIPKKLKNSNLLNFMITSSR